MKYAKIMITTHHADAGNRKVDASESVAAPVRTCAIMPTRLGQGDIQHTYIISRHIAKTLFICIMTSRTSHRHKPLANITTPTSRQNQFYPSAISSPAPFH